MTRQSTQARSVPRTKRHWPLDQVTSCDPGYAVPVSMIPVLPGDALTGVVNFDIEMRETRERLANAVNARFFAIFVPHLADPRFNGSMDQLQASAMGKPPVVGGAVVPYFETRSVTTTVRDSAVTKALGLHLKAGEQVNISYWNAYMLAQNYRRRERSMDLPMITSRYSLDAAMWPMRGRFSGLVPDFDLSHMYGEVPLQWVDGTAKVVPTGNGMVRVATRGASGGHPEQEAVGSLYYNGTGGTPANGIQGASFTPELAAGRPLFWPDGSQSGIGTNLVAEMKDAGLSLTLTGLQQARKLQAFATIRRRMEGLRRAEGSPVTDDDVIDFLMSGLQVSNLHLTQPWMIGYAETRIEQVKRWSTTAEQMDDSATNGFGHASMRMRLPRVECGGTVVVIAEYLPEQLWERQADPMINTLTYDALPNAYEDQLKEIRVDNILNSEIDALHADPDGLFAYGPEHWKWASRGYRIGGKFMQNADDTNSVERQRFWAVERANPKFAEDFMMSTGGVHKKVFLDPDAQPFEMVITGGCDVYGLTQFGPGLIEDTGNYDAVAEKVPDQYEKPE